MLYEYQHGYRPCDPGSAVFRGASGRMEYVETRKVMLISNVFVH